MLMMPALDSVFAKSIKVYDEAVIANFRDAMGLELENEMFFMMRLMEMVGSESADQILEAFKISPERITDISMRLYLCLFTFIDGVVTGDKSLEPILKKLSSLSLKLAEDKDAQITSIELVLDKEKHDSLEAGYAEYQKVVNPSA